MMPRQTPQGSGSSHFVDFTPDERAQLKRDLAKQLGPEYISKRKGPGFSSVQYLEGWKAINLANSIFGPTGWCTELRSFTVDYIDERGGSVSMGLSAVVRVCLKDGTFHEDIGYGSIDNSRSKSAAFDKCKKEAMTDGMKRALRQFGNALGNCLYDKDFLTQVTKVAQAPKKFDEANLRRVDEKEEKGSFAAIANAAPKTTVLPAAKVDTKPAPQPSALPPPKIESKPVQPAEAKKEMSDDFDSDGSFEFSDDWPSDLGPALANMPVLTNKPKPAAAPPVVTKPTPTPPPDKPTPPPTSVPSTVTFVGARHADAVMKDPSRQNTLQYNASQSTGISKSGFINHKRSAPVKQSTVRLYERNKKMKK